MTGALAIELSWPAKELSPNARVHHMALWRAKRDAKAAAGWTAKAALGNRRFTPPEGRIPVHFIATPPTQRGRDDDNLVASCKAHLDGIAAALGVNDNLFIAPTIEWLPPCAPGSLIITVGEVAK